MLLRTPYTFSFPLSFLFSCMFLNHVLLVSVYGNSANATIIPLEL